MIIKRDILRPAALTFIIAVVVFILISALAPAYNQLNIIVNANAIAPIIIPPGGHGVIPITPPKTSLVPIRPQPSLVVITHFTSSPAPTATPIPAPTLTATPTALPENRFILPGRLPNDLRPIMPRNLIIPSRPHFNITVSPTPQPNNTSTSGNATISLSREGFYVTKGGTLALIISRWGGDGPVSFRSRQPMALRRSAQMCSGRITLDKAIITPINLFP